MRISIMRGIIKQWVLFNVRTFAILLALASITAEAGQNRQSFDSKEAVTRGEAFLVSLFDQELGLLPEYRGSKTYWVFHDNYLAAHALADLRPDLSRQIRATLLKFGVTNSGKIEIVYNEASQPLPFRMYQLTNVAVLEGKRIRTEVVTTNVLNGWREYADLLLLAALAQAQSAQGQARQEFERAEAMWDGRGFKDRATKATGIYATYKLALYLLAAERLKLKPVHHRDALEQLLAMQGQEGGWITDYKDGRSVGLANVETTCLAILALKALK